MSTEKTIEKLVDKAIENRLCYTEIKKEALKEALDCEFISCKEKAILNLDGFDVCVSHGFRLIQCITEKLDDTEKQKKENNDEIQ